MVAPEISFIAGMISLLSSKNAFRSFIIFVTHSILHSVCYIQYGCIFDNFLEKDETSWIFKCPLHIWITRTSNISLWGCIHRALNSWTLTKICILVHEISCWLYPIGCSLGDFLRRGWLKKFYNKIFISYKNISPFHLSRFRNLYQKYNPNEPNTFY